MLNGRIRDGGVTSEPRRIDQEIRNRALVAGVMPPVGPAIARLPTSYTCAVLPARLIALLFVTLVATMASGCGRWVETRFDAVPGPVRSRDLATAAGAEAAPLTPAEWQAVDRVHDAYLMAFDALRAELLVSVVRDAREATTGRDDVGGLPDHLAEVAALARRHRTALGRIRALDERLFSDLGEALPARTAFVERAMMRRAIDRSAQVHEGLDDGSLRRATILDIEPVLESMDLTAAERGSIEPLLVDHRRRLAAAAQALADADIAYPAAWMEALAARGLDPATIRALRDAKAEGEDRKEAWKQADQTNREARLEAGRTRAEAMAAVDAANRRTLAGMAAVLPADRAAQVAERMLVRRTDSTDSAIPAMRFALGALASHPEVRGGRLPLTARAVDEARRHLADAEREDELRRAQRLAAAVQGTDPDAIASPALKDALARLAEKLQLAKQQYGVERGTADDGLVDAIDAIDELTAAQATARLAPMLGPRAAAQLVARAPRSFFRAETAEPEPEWRKDLSIAEQLLLAPGMDHDSFRRAAGALGARPDDPLVEQVWERHEARRLALETRQRETLRSMEARTMELARGGGDGPEAEERARALERALGEYLQALLNADAERVAADDETFREVAIVIDLPEGDSRMVLARAISAARRAALPWRRFQQPWLLGPLWESDADPLSYALLLREPLVRDAAVAVVALHATRLQETAEVARRAGLESLRDLVVFGLRKQRSGSVGRPADYMADPEVQSMVRRIADAGRARRAVQRQAIESVAAVDPALGAEFMRAWSQATFPEFFLDGTAWRDAGAASAAIPADASADVLSAADRWRTVDADMVTRLLRWQDERPADVPVPDDLEALALRAQQDAVLGTLRTLRDENAWRLLRAIAVGAGDAPDARMQDAPRGGALAAPVSWSP